MRPTSSVCSALRFDNRDGAGEAGGRAFDLEREAGDGEAGRGQRLEIGELLDVAVADLHPGAVPFPDDRRVAAFRKAARRVDEGRIPAPGVGAGDAHAALEKMERCATPHAAAAREI